MDPCGSNGKMRMLWSHEFPYIDVCITDDDANECSNEVPVFRKQSTTTNAIVQRFGADCLRSFRDGYQNVRTRSYAHVAAKTIRERNSYLIPVSFSPCTIDKVT